MVQYVAALDIGTTSLRMLVGKITDSSSKHIIAKAAMPCRGVKKYKIENEQELTSSIQRMLKRIEEQTDIIVRSTYVSIQGVYVGRIKNTAVIDVDEPSEVDISMLVDLLDMAADIDLYENEHLVDVLPVKYIIDNHTSVSDPLGMTAESLRVEADILTADKEMADQIIRCLENAGLETDGFIPFSVAMTDMLPDYETENGSTLLIDVGGTSSEFSVYNRNYPYFSASLPVGGDHITNDIASVLHISRDEAENIKRDYAIAAAELVTNNVDVAVFDIEKGMQQVVKIKDIVEIMEARIVEMLNLMADELEKEGIDTSKIDRVIFSGDGLSSFNGLDILCRDIFACPYMPVDFSRATGMKSCYTYAGGMINYISKLLPLGRMESKIEKKSFASEVQPGGGNSIFAGAKEKFKGFLSRFKE